MSGEDAGTFGGGPQDALRMQRLQDLRREIDDLDAALARLLRARIRTGRRAAQLRQGIPGAGQRDEWREAEIVRSVHENMPAARDAADTITRDQVTRIYEGVFEATRGA